MAKKKKPNPLDAQPLDTKLKCGQRFWWVCLQTENPEAYAHLIDYCQRHPQSPAWALRDHCNKHLLTEARGRPVSDKSFTKFVDALRGGKL